MGNWAGIVGACWAEVTEQCALPIVLSLGAQETPMNWLTVYPCI